MLQGELHVHVHSSRDYPGIVCVSQESQDTRTNIMLQGELHVHTFISGLSWDSLCIPGITGYSDKGHAARRTTCICTFIPGLSWDGLYPRNPRILEQEAYCKESFVHPGIV